jgi:outer membrane lipoprotein carrier protein
VTVIKFADLERNPKLPPDAFKFTPPPGADVIRE